MIETEDEWIGRVAWPAECCLPVLVNLKLEDHGHGAVLKTPPLLLIHDCGKIKAVRLYALRQLI